MVFPPMPTWIDLIPAPAWGDAEAHEDATKTRRKELSRPYRWILPEPPAPATGG